MKLKVSDVLGMLLGFGLGVIGAAGFITLISEITGIYLWG